MDCHNDTTQFDVWPSSDATTCQKRRSFDETDPRKLLRTCKLTIVWPGGPGQLPPRAPTDPDVRALAHPVPRPTGSPSTMVPEAIRSSYGDMRKNLDVFNMSPQSSLPADVSLPSTGSSGASSPCFHGTIKTLRLPAAHSTALCCLRLAVPRLHSLISLLGGQVPPPRPGVGNPATPSGNLPRRRQDLQSSWTTQSSVCACSSTPAGLPAPDQLTSGSMAPAMTKRKAPTIILRIQPRKQLSPDGLLSCGKEQQPAAPLAE